MKELRKEIGMEGPRFILDHWKVEFPEAEIKLGALIDFKSEETGLVISLSFPQGKSFSFKVSPSEIKRLKGIRNMDLIWTRKIKKELER